MELEKIYFDEQGLVPTVVQDHATGEVLMVAWMNAESLARTLQTGETLRGLLLTSYGFSIFGERAQQAAWVCYLVALVLLLASIAGFVHAFTTPKDETI